MGGCYSATKRMMKENAEAPAPQVAKDDDTVAKEATPVASEPKEVIISEVVTTTPEVSDATSEVVADPVKDATIEVASAPKEEATSKVIGLVEETSTETVVCVKEDATLKEAKLLTEESGSVVKTEGNVATDEVTVEAVKVNDESDVKETKKEEDDSMLIEKKTLEEESGPKGEEAKENEKVLNVIETKSEDVKVVG